LDDNENENAKTSDEELEKQQKMLQNHIIEEVKLFDKIVQKRRN